jgi:membrane protease subunit (stomatin/prohibitin family)
MISDRAVFLEVIEWFDDTGKEVVHRVPEKGSGEIKFGAQMTVRESQVGVFFYQGKACEAFGPGRHTLKTANIPILTKILSLPWSFTSPLRAEVYFVNMKDFPNLKWGTRDPVAFRDSQLGLIRLRAFGVFCIRVLQPLLFINRLVGTQGIYETEDIEEYLSRIIVSRFNDLMGESIDTIFDLPGRYERLSQLLVERLQSDLAHYGLNLSQLFINSITPPPEVQEAIDDKSKLGVFGDLDRLLKLKAASALEKAAEGQGETGATLGAGLGFMMPAMFADLFRNSSTQSAEVAKCPDCKRDAPKDARFCPHCGHQLLIFSQCAHCGKNLPVSAQFCSRCGKAMKQEPQSKRCPHCMTENIMESVFCNQCGERL